MDIKINAQGRYVEVTGIEDVDLLQATEVVYDLWDATEVPDPENKVKELSAGTGAYLEKKHTGFGFADMREGERLSVK